MMGLPRLAPRTPEQLGPQTPESQQSPAPIVSFACFGCAARKTKCDKVRPACSTCRRRQVKCVYENPTVIGVRKRKPAEHENGPPKRLADRESRNSRDPSGTDPYVEEAISVRDDRLPPIPHVEPQKGRLIVGDNQSRYVNSALWRQVGAHDLDLLDYEESNTDADATSGQEMFPPASLSRGLLGTKQSVTEHLPRADRLLRLWKAYVENVEPLFKFLHVPTTAEMVQNASMNLPHTTSEDQCILFAMSLLALSSLSEDECLTELGESRAALLARYDHCTRQALFNASWLSSSHVSVLLALVMYLTVLQRQADPRSLWIWTGMGTRIMQRMGVHRDGEMMGLNSFDVEMRRRIFWNLVPLDIYAGRISGATDSGPPATWDTKPPMNVNDDQISPGMADPPRPRVGASDMMFRLVRLKLEELFAADDVSIEDGPASAWNARETKIDAIEDDIERSFLRYCDPVEPLHAASQIVARAAIAATRMRQRITLLVRRGSGQSVDPREFFALARRVLDADAHIATNPVLRPFAWHLRASFRLDALFCLLIALGKPGFLAAEDINSAWIRIGDWFSRRPEILQGRGRRYQSMGRIVLKAWLTSSSATNLAEPEFITRIRAVQERTSGPQRPADQPSSISSLAQPTDDSFFDLDAFLNSTLIEESWDSLFHVSV